MSSIPPRQPAVPPSQPPPGSELGLTLGGNAAVLIEAAGARVLTDPWLSDRIGPGRRLRPAAVGGEALRDLDAVLVSHAHPDHLDPPSLRRLAPGTPVLSPGG